MGTMMTDGMHPKGRKTRVWVYFGVIRLSSQTHSTPIPLAPQNGHGQVVEQLLKAGADKEKAKDGGDTPLHTACQVCFSELVCVS